MSTQQFSRDRYRPGISRVGTIERKPKLGKNIGRKIERRKISLDDFSAFDFSAQQLGDSIESV